MRAKKTVDIGISDLYAMKFASLWQALKQEHLSLWMLCFYFLFEYVRPQSLYPVIRYHALGAAVFDRIAYHGDY